MQHLRHFAVALTCVGLLLAADAAAQSLGETARREGERRKAVASSGKVYTDANLKPEPPSAPAPSSSGAEPVSPAPAAAVRPEASPATEPAARRDEGYWRKRIQEERELLARAEVFAEALQTRINSLTADVTSRDDPAQRAVVTGNRAKALAELDRVKQEIQQRTKAVADIQEEGRRAGALAAWLR